MGAHLTPTASRGCRPSIRRRRRCVIAALRIVSKAACFGNGHAYTTTYTTPITHDNLLRERTSNFRLSLSSSRLLSPAAARSPVFPVLLETKLKTVEELEQPHAAAYTCETGNPHTRPKQQQRAKESAETERAVSRSLPALFGMAAEPGRAIDGVASSISEADGAAKGSEQAVRAVMAQIAPKVTTMQKHMGWGAGSKGRREEKLFFSFYPLSWPREGLQHRTLSRRDHPAYYTSPTDSCTTGTSTCLRSTRRARAARCLRRRSRCSRTTACWCAALVMCAAARWWLLLVGCCIRRNACLQTRVRDRALT